MPSWKKVIVSGSDASLNNLSVSTLCATGNIRGSVICATSCFVGNFCGNATTATSSTTATTAGNSNCLGSAPQVCYVMTCGNQTVAGVKTFSSCIVASGGVCGVASSAVTATTATTAGNSNCLGSAPQVCYVMMCGNQTVGGVKTFSSCIVGSTGIAITGTACVSSNICSGGEVRASYFRSDAGTNSNILVNANGATIIKRLSTNGGISIGTDDIVIIGAGETRGTLETNLNCTDETVWVGGENGVYLVTSPDNWTSGFAGRRQALFDTAGTFCAPNLRAANICSMTSICGPMVCVSGTVSGNVLNSVTNVAFGTTLNGPAGIIINNTGSPSTCITTAILCHGGVISGNNICGITSVCSALVVSSGTSRAANLCATTSICGPLVVSSGTNRGANLCATTSICGPMVCVSGVIQGNNICAINVSRGAHLCAANTICGPMICVSGTATADVICGVTSVCSNNGAFSGCVTVGPTSPSGILTVSGSGTVLDIQGTQGQLFSVTDCLTGVLMSVNDISGLPILEVSSDDKVVMGTFGAAGLTVSGSSIKVGSVSTNVHTVTGSLNVSGSTNLTGEFTVNSTSTGPTVALIDTTAGNDPYIRFTPATATNAYALGVDDSDSDKFKISYGSNATLGTNDRLTIDTSGNVGINNTTPLASLDIRTGSIGTNTFTGLTVSSTGIDVNGGTAIFLRNTPNVVDVDRFGARIRSVRRAEANGAADIAFDLEKTDASGLQERVRIAGTGNVGIGITSPGCILSVGGAICSSNQIRGASIITAGTVCADSNIKGAVVCATSCFVGNFCGNATTATTATTAGNSNCLGGTPAACVMTLCGNQTVTGIKSFECDIKLGTAAGARNSIIMFTQDGGSNTVCVCLVAEDGGAGGTNTITLPQSTGTVALTNGTVNNANCLGSAPQVCYVMTCGNQSVAGVKTFSSCIVASGGLCGTASSAVSATTATTAGNSNCLGSAPQVCYTMNCGNQTVAGVKTFSSCIVASGGVCGVASSAVTATTATTAGNSNCLGSAPQVCYVMMCGNQTVAGVKTFSGTVCGSGLIRAVNLCATTTVCTPVINASSRVSGTSVTSTVIENITGNPNPEGNFFLYPPITNDLAFTTLRGGAVTVICGVLNSPENMFNGGSSFANFNCTDMSANCGTIFEVRLPQALQYTTRVGLAFGNSTWRTNCVVVCAYSEGVWKTVIDTNSNSSDIIMGSVPTNSAVGTTCLRVELRSANFTSVRIAHLFAYDYNSDLARELFLPKDGGTVYGNTTYCTCVSIGATPSCTLTVGGAVCTSGQIRGAHLITGGTVCAGSNIYGGVICSNSCFVGNFCGNATTSTSATTATTAGNSNCLGSAPQVCYTMNCGNQTVGGVKTFSSCIVASGGVCGVASSAVTATTATTAGNSNCLGSAPQVCYVMMCGNQTVGGVKSFSSCIVASGGVCGTAASAVSVNLTDTTFTDTDYNPVFTDGGGTSKTLRVDTSTFTFNPSSNRIKLGTETVNGKLELIGPDTIVQPISASIQFSPNGTGTGNVFLCLPESSGIIALTTDTVAAAGNSNCLGSAPQVCYVMMCGNQTVGGVKTFSGTVCGSGIVRGVNLCATTSICGPLVVSSGTNRGANVCATTSICGPLIVSSGINRGVNLCATTSICGPMICVSGTATAANVCAITSVCSPRGIFSTCVDSCIYTSNAGGTQTVGSTTAPNLVYFDDPINGGTWGYVLRGGIITEFQLI